ncbi:MAG: hypothetical protein U9N46_14820 [Euryarchaeota archaeon]|nr:MAG: hypothetical protein C5S47_06175 [ANME-2 cluster archaeon]MEA1866432.1 hypothetical protein [Euryarchaeota archaeon]
MTSVRLPDLPKETEFEEYVSAFFQSGGYYIERNIIERKVEEVLELDIIITNYTHPKIKLIEVKSGGWGFPDIFKIRGWMDYLHIFKGAFIVSKEKRNIDFYKQIAEALNIDLMLISDLSKSKEALAGFISKEVIEKVDISTWRFSYWTERNLLKCLTHKKNSHIDKKCFRSLKEYHFEVNSKIFFTENIAKKVCELYDVFQKFPRISAKCGNELIGNSFDDECDAIPNQIFHDTYYECKYNDIQISTFIEHRARLAILKNAVDYKLYEETGDKNKTDDISKISGWNSEMWSLALLPQSFKDGLNMIAKYKYFDKYPVFWQWFMWVFGGFILKDYEEKEYEILSQKTGIPVGEIPTALEAYQILFPLNDGWFMDLSPSSNIKVMKLFPVPFMGVGANYRRLLYTDSGKFEDLELTGTHTLNDLVKWNNLTVEVLKND